MTGFRPKFAAVLIAVVMLSASSASAASSSSSTGSIAGFVRDNAGVPQMGATVLLMNRFERIIQRAVTNERGAFGFEPLIPDLYSIRVSLTSFVPALKQKIAVQPGLQSLLYVNLASMMSSVELVYAAPGQSALMSDDWKWTLKSSLATRPVLRLLPNAGMADPERTEHASTAVFSSTRGLVKVSAGDSGSLANWNMPDLGTAFALATSLFGANQLSVSGNVGYTSHSGIPATGFRAGYSREGASPEVTVTMRQLYLPARAGTALITSQPDGMPALRTLSLTMADRLEIADGLTFDYGMSLDSVSFLDHLNYMSPYARLSYEAGPIGVFEVAFSSGAPPTELFTHTGEAEAELSQGLAALAVVPRVSLKGQRARVQRTQTFELGYQKKFGTRTLSLSGYRDTIGNGALTISGAEDLFAGDILPDISSRSSVINFGNFERFGYAAGLMQAIGEHVEAGVGYGRTGVLTADGRDLDAAGGLQQVLHSGLRHWASVRAAATLPVVGTQITTSYQWMNPGALMPAHLFLTQRSYAETGLNIQVRQPIPAFAGLPGRLEATAELRNMLAQGYLSISSAQRTAVLTQTPRAVRGGLSFIF